MMQQKQLLEIKEKETLINFNGSKNEQEDTNKIIIINNIQINDEFKFNKPLQRKYDLQITDKEKKIKQSMKKIEEKSEITIETPEMKEIRGTIKNKKLK